MNNNFSFLYINISDQISFCNHNKPKTDELTQLFLSDTFSIDDLLYRKKVFSKCGRHVSKSSFTKIYKRNFVLSSGTVRYYGR